jgi:hypothetical protein
MAHGLTSRRLGLLLETVEDRSGTKAGNENSLAGLSVLVVDDKALLRRRLAARSTSCAAAISRTPRRRNSIARIYCREAGVEEVVTFLLVVAQFLP